MTAAPASPPASSPPFPQLGRSRLAPSSSTSSSAVCESQQDLIPGSGRRKHRHSRLLASQREHSGGFTSIKVPLRSKLPEHFLLELLGHFPCRAASREMSV